MKFFSSKMAADQCYRWRYYTILDKDKIICDGQTF